MKVCLKPRRRSRSICSTAYQFYCSRDIVTQINRIWLCNLNPKSTVLSSTGLGSGGAHSDFLKLGIDTIISLRGLLAWIAGVYEPYRAFLASLFALGAGARTEASKHVPKRALI